MPLVAVSRWCSRRLLGLDLMLCAIADLYRWRARHVFDAAFIWRERNHCARCADWEAFRRRERDFIDLARCAGWL